MTSWLTEYRGQAGFSLLELSITLIVFALLAGSLLGQLPAQRQIADEQRARRQLDEALEALYGFAITHGRLPCPAPPELASDAAEAGHEACPREHGTLPWRTLALPELDPWGQRFSYHAKNSFTAVLSGGARASFTLESVGTANVRPAAAVGNRLADALPAVVVCHGRNGAGGYRSSGSQVPAGNPDEAENADADLIFVDRLPDPGYDDLLAWIVPGLLNARMLAAGRLP